MIGIEGGDSFWRKQLGSPCEVEPICVGNRRALPWAEVGSPVGAVECVGEIETRRPNRTAEKSFAIPLIFAADAQKDACRP
jgi:hypothetical protein